MPQKGGRRRAVETCGVGERARRERRGAEMRGKSGAPSHITQAFSSLICVFFQHRGTCFCLGGARPCVRTRTIAPLLPVPPLPQDFHWEVMDHTKQEHPNALVAKALGGCGIHNAMLYVRGLESDFARWDVEGFDYASAVEMWKKNENYTGPGPLPEWHGRGGPIATSPPTFIDEVG